MTIAVGSTNKIKIQAVLNALEGANRKVIPCAADSIVRAQPLTDEETRQGAINRARDCLSRTDAEIGIGLEAGISAAGDDFYLCHWGALADRNGQLHITNGPLILLPQSYKSELSEGVDLETLMHRRTGIAFLGSKGGAVFFFTQGRLDREKILTQMVHVLLGQQEFYSKPSCGNSSR